MPLCLLFKWRNASDKQATILAEAACNWGSQCFACLSRFHSHCLHVSELLFPPPFSMPGKGNYLLGSVSVKRSRAGKKMKGGLMRRRFVYWCEWWCLLEVFSLAFLSPASECQPHFKLVPLSPPLTKHQSHFYHLFSIFFCFCFDLKCHLASQTAARTRGAMVTHRCWEGNKMPF